ncbi:MAG: hypothetical protein ACOYOE_13550 [Chlorobium sp.]
MTVEEILKMLDNPAIIGDALLEAAKLPFEGTDKVRFNEKRDQYIDGLSDHKLPNWVGQMKGLLSKYDGCSVGATDGESFRSYTLDRENQWHYLDKEHFRERVGEICGDENNPVKVIFIEHNVDAFSDQMDEILRSFIKEDHEEIHKSLGPTEGKMSHVIKFDNSEKLGASWADFMRKNFRISPNHEKIRKELRLKTDFYAKSHIIVHSVGKLDSTFRDNFQLYYNFWAALCPEHPVFLCLFLPPEHALPRDINPLPHWILCYCNEYEMVGPFHFSCFFKEYKCYQENRSLYTCDPMSFSDAVTKLRYR